MGYKDIMTILSQCGLGAMILSKENKVIVLNNAGKRLLHDNGDLEGRELPEQLIPLSMKFEFPSYVNVTFGEYLTSCPAPEVFDLPAEARLIVFRDATVDARHDMLISITNQMSEAILLCDSQSRVMLQNNAHIKMESIETKDILGENVSDIYNMSDESEMNIPEVIRTKKPKLNLRQFYTTRYGKAIDTVTNNYPIVQNGQVLGGFSIMEDWSTVDDLHKKIMELNEKLRSQDSKGKKQPENKLNAKYHFSDIIHISEAMNKTVTRCRLAAQTDSSIMLYGETGTGKELFAQSIHNAGKRKNKPFLAINCAAIPENLLESLLFGTEKGAYTGAERRMGLFEQANGGTLLLDEINSMAINLQAKLLRVLQDSVVRRVGGTSEIRVDVRVLSNTNIHPYQAIEENKLRRDLFYRLGVVNINIPPLRERLEDIPILAKTFIMQCNEKLGRNVRDLDSSVLEKFYTYAWPGNVRELQHAIEHAMNILPNNLSEITMEYIPEYLFDNYMAPLYSSGSVQGKSEVKPVKKHALNKMHDTIHEIEYSGICAALNKYNGNISKAALELSLSRQNLQYRIKKYKIDITRYKN